MLKQELNVISNNLYKYLHIYGYKRYGGMLYIYLLNLINKAKKIAANKLTNTTWRITLSINLDTNIAKIKYKITKNNAEIIFFIYSPLQNINIYFGILT